LGPQGSELTALSSQKHGFPQISQVSGANNVALNDNIIEKYPELQQVISAWPELPEQVKVAIVEIVQKQTAEKK
jgi:hypothetical protein